MMHFSQFSLLLLYFWQENLKWMVIAYDHHFDNLQLELSKNLLKVFIHANIKTDSLSKHVLGDAKNFQFDDSSERIARLLILRKFLSYLLTPSMVFIDAIPVKRKVFSVVWVPDSLILCVSRGQPSYVRQAESFEASSSDKTIIKEQCYAWFNFGKMIRDR